MFNARKGRLAQGWSYDTGSVLVSAPIIHDIDDDGRPEILFGTKNGKIIVIDHAAKPKWSYNIQESIDNVELMFMDSESMNSVMATPVVADINGDGKKEIIFASELGVVYVLTANGKLIWKFNCGGAVRGSVEVADSNGDKLLEIMVASMDGFVYALNCSGKLIWKYHAGAALESSPLALKSGQIIFGDDQGNINSISFEGKLLWQYKTEGKILSKPVAGNIYGTDELIILVGSVDNSLYALDDKGRLKWSYETQGALNTEVVLEDINKDGKLEIIFGSCDNNVYALTCDGEKIWSFETNFWVVAKPIVTDIDGDGKLEVIIGSYDHNIYILDSEGTYILEHIPGIGGIVHQQGNYAEVQTQEAGDNAGKKIWQLKTDGIIVGCAYIDKLKNIIVNMKHGKVASILHQT